MGQRFGWVLVGRVIGIKGQLRGGSHLFDPGWVAPSLSVGQAGVLVTPCPPFSRVLVSDKAPVVAKPSQTERIAVLFGEWPWILPALWGLGVLWLPGFSPTYH